MSFLIRKLINISEDWFGGSDYYRVIYTFYILGGIWMLKIERVEKNKCVSALFRFLRYFTFLVCAVCLASFAYDAYLIRKSIEKLTYNVGVTVFFVGSLIRFFFLSVKKEDFEEMLDAINRNLYLEGIGTSPRDLRILRRGEWNLIRISKGFYCLQTLGVIFKVLCHAVSEKTLPIPFPYFGRVESPIYEILFVLEVVGFTHFVAVVIAQTLVTYGILIRVSHHFIILSENISDIGRSVYRQSDDVGIGNTKNKRIGRKDDSRWDQEKIFALLKKNAIHHREILRIMKRASSLLQESLFFEIFGGGMLLVDLFFHVTLNLQRTKNAAFLIINQFIFSVSALLEVTIICYYGSQIQTRSVEAANALYSIDWLRMDLRNKQTVRFMQMALWKHPIIKAGSFSLNLGMYVKFLQSIYSYLAFMQNTL